MNFCSEEQVKSVFNAIFDEDIVEKVVTVEKTDIYTHKKTYKMFFVHFDKTNRRLEHFIEQIKTNGFQQVIYDKNGYFWKVIIAETKKTTPFLPERIEKSISTVSDVNILFIKYAKNDCTEEQVKLYIDTAFGEEVVEKVVTVEKKDFKTGDPFKMFFIHFNKTNGHLEYVINDIMTYSDYKLFLDVDKKFYWKLQIPIKKEEEKPFVPAVVEIPAEDKFETPVKEKDDCPAPGLGPRNKTRGQAPELDLSWDGESIPPPKYTMARMNSIDLYPEARRIFEEIDREEAEAKHRLFEEEEGEINFESDSGSSFQGEEAKKWLMFVKEEKELSVEDIDRMIHTVTIPIKEEDLKAPFKMERTISVSEEEKDIIDSKVALKHTVCDVILEGDVLADIMSKVSLESRLEDIFEPRPLKLKQRSKMESSSPAKKQKVKKV